MIFNDAILNEYKLSLPLSVMGVVKREKVFQPDGKLIIYLPDASKFSIPFSKEEDTVKEIKERIRDHGINLNNFLCICNAGTLYNNDVSAKELKLSNNSRIILVKKDVCNKSNAPLRNSILKNKRKSASRIVVPNVRNRNFDALVP